MPKRVDKGSVTPGARGAAQATHAIAASNPGVARAMQEETLSLSIAKDLQRLVREAKPTCKQRKPGRGGRGSVGRRAGRNAARIHDLGRNSAAMAMDASVQLVPGAESVSQAGHEGPHDDDAQRRKLLSHKPSAAGPA